VDYSKGHAAKMAIIYSPLQTDGRTDRRKSTDMTALSENGLSYDDA